MSRDRIATDRRTGAARSAMRVDGPAALVQAVPYLLGFHPAHSLVIVGLCDGILEVTARVDLGPADGGGDVAHAVDVLARNGVTEAIAIVFDDDPGAADVQATLALLTALVSARHVCLLDVLAVTRGRWRSLGCVDPACCPPDGRRLDDQISEFAAAATFAGVAALPDRASLAAILQPGPTAARDGLAPLIAAAQDEAAARRAARTRAGADMRSTRALFAAARKADRDSAPPYVQVCDAVAAQLAASLADIAVRDSVWMAIDDGRLDGRRLWADLARRLPSPHDAAPAFLFGWAEWRDGNGAMALIAARRALEADPGYSAADLLLAALSRGVDPRAVPKLRRARRSARVNRAQPTRTNT